MTQPCRHGRVGGPVGADALPLQHDAFAGDQLDDSIGIRDGRIEAISQTPLRGRTLLDASGLVVAPGFIDLHAHGQDLPAARMQAFDGVTTALELEAGTLPIAAAYKHVAREGRPINYGFSAS